MLDGNGEYRRENGLGEKKQKKNRKRRLIRNTSGSTYNTKRNNGIEIEGVISLNV